MNCSSSRQQPFFVKTLPKLWKGRCVWIANSYYPPRYLCSIKAHSLRPQSLQFINAWVKTNSHPSAEWCGPRWDGIMASARLAVWGETRVTTATTLQLTWRLWPRWEANHISLCATHSPPLEQEEKEVLSSYLDEMVGYAHTSYVILEVNFFLSPLSLHSPSLHGSTMNFCSVGLSPCYYPNCEGHSVMWRFVAIANPIIKARVVHRMGDNTSTDRWPPAHLLPCYSTKGAKSRSLSSPSPMSIHRTSNGTSIIPTSWVGEGGDDKNFLIKGRECSISFWFGKQEKERRINLKAVVLLPIPTPVSELKKHEWIMGCPSAVGSGPDWDFLSG